MSLALAVGSELREPAPLEFAHEAGSRGKAGRAGAGRRRRGRARGAPLGTPKKIPPGLGGLLSSSLLSGSSSLHPTKPTPGLGGSSPNPTGSRWGGRDGHGPGGTWDTESGRSPPRCHQVRAGGEGSEGPGGIWGAAVGLEWSELSLQGWEWGCGLSFGGDESAGAPVGMGLPVPLGAPRWRKRRCHHVPCPPRGPARGGSARGLTGLSPNPHFQGEAGVLSPGQSRSFVPRAVPEGQAEVWCGSSGLVPSLGDSGTQKFSFFGAGSVQTPPCCSGSLGDTVLDVTASARCPCRGLTAGSQLSQGHPGDPEGSAQISELLTPSHTGDKPPGPSQAHVGQHRTGSQGFQIHRKKSKTKQTNKPTGKRGHTW